MAALLMLVLMFFAVEVIEAHVSFATCHGANVAESPTCSDAELDADGDCDADDCVHGGERDPMSDPRVIPRLRADQQSKADSEYRFRVFRPPIAAHG